MRTEHDSMGPVQLPDDALYGPSTQRAVENFPIAHRPIPAEVIHALGHLKAAAAEVNHDLGKLDDTRAEAIIEAANSVAAGEHDRHFPVDVYQTGSGTSSNMNANEVIANLAADRHEGTEARRHEGGGKRRSDEATERRSGAPNHPITKSPNHQINVHPNDHVNMGQSSNDTFPTALHVAAAKSINSDLVPALRRLGETLTEQSNRWDEIVKIGRTHLMDATPIRVGQVFSGYAEQAELAVGRAHKAVRALSDLAIGGTAVGTGINTHPQFGKRVAAKLSERTGIEFAEAPNHPEAQAAKDAVVEAHAQLKTIAVSLSKIANDIRHLGSGPRCGLGELLLPAIQPGSSIMPGKVNPVICESLMQVAVRVTGNDQTITTAGLGGVGSIFELNLAMPLMADTLLESIHLLTNSSHVFVDKLLVGLEVDEKRCRQLIDRSLMTVTALAPEIGYDQAAKLAKQALAEDRTIREIALEQNLLDESHLDELLNPRRMTDPR